MKIIKPLNNIKIVPRWIIFTFDIAVSAIAFFFAYVLCYNFQVDSFTNENFAIDFLFCIGLTALSFMIFRLYSGIVRYTSAVDSIRILSTIVFTSITMFIAKLAFIAFSINITIPTNLIITYALFAFTGLTTYRTCIKIFFQYTKSTRNGRKNAIVYGAGDLGIAVKRTFEHDFRADKTIVAYMDDSEEKIGKVIDGLKIFSSKDFQRIVRKYGVDELIIASTRIDIETKNLVVEQALELNVNVLTLPPVHKIINGDLSPAQIKQVKIEDLLERAPIQISNMKLLDQLRGKRVLVTGAAGSIGSEISKQLGKYEPQMIILCDQAESPLHNLQLDLQDQFKNQIYHTFIADIRSQERMRLLFETFKPHFVYHAAAYKHVPMMENHPSEGVKTNVFGTYQLANLAVEFDVQKFVFVSTDKAVNPTNVMGATKRIAEKYVQSLNNYLTSVNGIKSTKFITTRFGNVLGSNGSVIPRFKDQIEKGGPVTVTHPDI
ncbi:SDR family NAD(P)-dependent oxidoreductase, partial [Sphingobacterium lactis]|uniref:SDR family NAD(P)-dependent oxidoreductase n=1 Tax=Sphingobacterium lactis TaxID=797291 RepID=UPI003DA5F260